MYITENFSLPEFECPCCGKAEIVKPFVVILQAARYLADIPFEINSGYRCPKHNKAIGSKSTSSHLKGLAADIGVTNNGARVVIVRSLLRVGFDRIGMGKTFIHVDMDNSKPDAMWSY